MGKVIALCNKVLWMGIALVVILMFVRHFVPAPFEGFRSWNALPAHIATYLLLITVLPGVFVRMGIMHPLLRLVIAWRRTLGIAMYFFVLVHLLFLLDELPWFSGGIITSLDVLTATGLFAMIVLLPALLTSNTGSIRFFRKHWKTLQRTTYISIPLIAYHLYESGETLPAVAYAATSALIIFSYFFSYYKQKISGIRLVSTSLATILVACGTTFTTVSYYSRDLSGESASSVTIMEARTEQDEEEFVAVDDVIEADRDGALEEDVVVDDAGDDAEDGESDEQTVYEDGTYTANGEYETDHGKLIESLDVTLVVEDDVVQEMGIVGYIINNKSQRYHDRFEASIDRLIIGEELSEIDVDAVAGASDTTDGFMVAIKDIQVQALSQ